jgi:hypothetical protein
MSAEQRADPDAPVAVGAYLNHVEAELARSALEAAGIESMIRSDDAGGMYPSPWMGWAGGVEVLVRAADVEAARDVLDLDRPAG